MALAADAYVDSMLALLPEGAPWPRDPDSWWALLFRGLYPEYLREQSMLDQMLNEMSVSTAQLFFQEYEAEYGLPDKCVASEQTVSQRRASLVIKEAAVGRQDKQFFIDVAAQLGFEITITEYSENNPGPQTDYNGLPIRGADWNFVWQINAPQTTVQPRQYGSAYGEAYTVFGNDILECAMRNLAHDHRVLFFAYSD